MFTMIVQTSFIAPFTDRYVILKNFDCSTIKQAILIARAVEIFHSSYSSNPRVFPMQMIAV